MSDNEVNGFVKDFIEITKQVFTTLDSNMGQGKQVEVEYWMGKDEDDADISVVKLGDTYWELSDIVKIANTGKFLSEEQNG